MAYKKPQDPLINNGFGIYPLTTADQVILSDGSRLEKNGQISIGGGTVKTVSGVAPDSAGNVALTASDVGARPNTWMPSASDVGALPSDGTAADSSKLGGVAASDYALKTDTAPDSSKLGGKAPGEYVQKSDVVDLKKITSGTNINGKVPSAQALMDCIYARPGTEFSRIDKVPYAGILTASAKDLRFCIPVPYVVNNGQTVTFTKLIGGIRVSGGGYISDGIAASDSSDWLAGPAINTVTGTIYKGILYLNINMKNAVDNASNNTPINAQLGFKFTVN